MKTTNDQPDNVVKQPATRTPRQSTPRFNLTAAFVNSATCPADKRIAWIRDAKAQGLVLAVSPFGRKTFYFKHRSGPRPNDTVAFKLGVWPGCSLDLARHKAAAALVDINVGKDPRADRRAAIARKTVGDLFAHFFESHAKPNKKSWRADEWQWKTYLAPELANVDHDRVDTERVLTLRNAIHKASGLYAANRAMSLLSSIYRHGELIGVKYNPCRVPKLREESRDRFVRPEELPLLWKAIEKLSKTGSEGVMFASFFEMLLYTGARRSNVQAMAWKDIDMKAAVWTIPGDQFKNGKLHKIALVPQAITLLQKRRAIVPPEVTWVFPSHGKSGHITEPKGPWKVVITEAKLAGLRIHDLRRTHGSYMAALNSSLTMIGAALGHRSQSATAVYSRLDLAPVRAATSAAVSLMTQLATEVPKPSDTKGARKTKKKSKSP